MSLRRVFITASILALAGLLFFAPAAASTHRQDTTTVTFDPTRLAQPPTVYPPSQANNGAQTYWGRCMSCHGDHGQGLTDEWRGSFPPEYQNCWDSGCHSADQADNSFVIPETGAPKLAGAGALSRYSNAFELQRYISKVMPLFPAGSLTDQDAWDLTAYILRLNGIQPEGLALGDTNSAVVSVHHEVTPPESPVPGALVLAGLLILSAAGLYWRYNRGAIAAGSARPSFFHHLHPPRIPALQARLRYTLGAGGLAVFLSLILLVTGLLEMYYYVPTPEGAAVSVQVITALVPYGGLVRGLHYWSAQLLVVVMTAHLLRVVLTGAYAPPRRFNYLLGLGLLVLILLLDFTGYVLRWDEGIHWALVVGTNLLRAIPLAGEILYRFVIGGTQPGGSTLIRFYAWHLFGLTIFTVVLVVWHAFRVRRDGGIAAPSERRADQVRITRFELVRREVLAMLVGGAILILLAMLIPAPIAPPITGTGALAGDSTAPWFFLWVQQLLKFGDPFLLGVLIPVVVLLVMGLLPYILPNAKDEELGRWFPHGNRLAQAIALLIFFVIIVLTILGALPGT